jgi:hypothetical protein
MVAMVAMVVVVVVVGGVGAAGAAGYGTGGRGAHDRDKKTERVSASWIDGPSPSAASNSQDCVGVSLPPRAFHDFSAVA